MSVQAAKVLAVAKAEVDAKYKEGKNNDTKYGKWFGLNNQPWCAMFVSWCFNQAGLGSLIKGAQTPKGFASCQMGLDWFKKRKQVVKISEAQPGDIVFFQFDDDTPADHVGIVVSNHPVHKEMVTYEGNTAADGSGSQFNGDGAYKKKRPYSKIMAVARPKYTA